MAENNNRYDLILMNNASREFHVFSGLTDVSGTSLFYHFEIDLDIAEGEYTYVVLLNNREDVSYDLTVPLLDSTAHTERGDAVIRDLQPSTGLLRVGDEAQSRDNIYDNNETKTIFYYDGK